MALTLMALKASICQKGNTFDIEGNIHFENGDLKLYWTLCDCHKNTIIYSYTSAKGNIKQYFNTSCTNDLSSKSDVCITPENGGTSVNLIRMNFKNVFYLF